MSEKRCSLCNLQNISDIIDWLEKYDLSTEVICFYCEELVSVITEYPEVKKVLTDYRARINDSR